MRKTILLIATSSLACFNINSVNGANVLVNNQIHRPASLDSQNHWIGGTPNNGDNIFMTGYQGININGPRPIPAVPRPIPMQLGTINLYGFHDNDIEINANCTIDNIVNDISQNAQNIVTATNQNQPIQNGGDNNAQANIVFGETPYYMAERNTLTIRSNQLDSVKSIQLKNNTLEFASAVTVNAPIYNIGAPLNGTIIAKQDIIFNNKIGYDNQQQKQIYRIDVANGRTATFHNDVAAHEISFLGDTSKVRINPNNHNIRISDIHIQDNLADNSGIVEILGDQNNTVSLGQVGAEDDRVKLITIADGNYTTFRDEVYAKKIELGLNNVTFEGNVDLFRRQTINRVRQNIVDRGLLEFQKHSRIEIKGRFEGDITTQTANTGHVLVTNNSTLYNIGQQNLPIGTLEFQNDAQHTLCGDVYTDNIIFDNGNYTAENNNIKIVVPQVNIVNAIPTGWQYVQNSLIYIIPVQTNQQQQAPQQQIAQQLQNAQQPLQNQAIQPAADSSIVEALQTESIQPFTEDLLQSPQLKIVVAQAATPTMQNYQNIEDTLSQIKPELKRRGINIESSNELIQLAGKDQSIINKTKEEKAILYALSMAPLSKAERNENNRQIENIKQKQELAKYATETIHRTIGNRIDELSLNNLAIGVSAGDESTKKIQGVWVKGTYSSSKKGASKGVSGYKGNSIGGTIGIDFELNDQNILGLAYSNMRSGFKYNSAGNKISGDSHILSLYSSHQLNDALMLKTMFSAGINNINTKRLAAGNIATGKIKNRSYSAETNLGYKINTSQNLFIIPNIGLRYANYKDSAYSEYGAGVHNISVKAKSNNIFSTTAGVNMMMHKKASETLLIVPSIHASVESHLNNNKDKVKAKFAWMDNYFENSIASKKSEKFSYNLGGGITVKQNNNLEVSANYNCNLYNKYQNHQGSIKLKILL